MPDLVLLTDGFPFDGYESVLASELDVTAERFDQIFIIPHRSGKRLRQLPPNAVVVDLGWSAGWPRQAKVRALASRAALRVLGTTLNHASNWPAYRSDARAYLDILATNVLKARRLEEWLNQSGVREAVFYDFWFENSTLAMALLRRSGAIRMAVSRAHRFDIYDECWKGGRVPFREFKVRNLDGVFAISEHGVRYLLARLNSHRAGLRHHQPKIRLARLGVPSANSYPVGVAEPPLIVSCAYLSARKRVHLLPEVLSACGRRLRWSHFGDGPERSRVEAAASALPGEVSWTLHGSVDNADLQTYYRTHKVSAFVSLSESEGIPVSMMEAQRFGIPIVALAVGGVPEIVTDETGLLVEPDAPVTDLVDALQRALVPDSFDPERIRAAFTARYDASSNYGSFADDLLSLWGANSAHRL